MADDEARVVDGDHILAICGVDFKQKGRLNNDTIVATVMSNLGLFRSMQEHGIKVIKAKVGDRYVLDTMMKEDLNVGGEQSGHVIFRDYTTTGDGLITSLQVLRIIMETGKKLSKLANCMTKYPQVLVNVAVKEKPELESIPEIKAAVQEVENALGENGRLLLRYSGTECVARVMIEGHDDQEIQRLANSLADVVRSCLG